MNIAKQMASVVACTPQRMAQAGVPLEHALKFHTQIRTRGPQSDGELGLLQRVRQMVTRAP